MAKAKGAKQARLRRRPRPVPWQARAAISRRSRGPRAGLRRPPPPPPPPPGYGTLTPPGPDSGAAPYAGPTELTPPRVASAGGCRSIAATSVGYAFGLRLGAVQCRLWAAANRLTIRGRRGRAAQLCSAAPDRSARRQRPVLAWRKLLARGKYTEAAAAFADGYKRYPKGAKARRRAAEARHVARPCRSEAQRLHRADAARPRIPASRSSAIRDRAAQEKKKLGC